MDKENALKNIRDAVVVMSMVSSLPVKQRTEDQVADMLEARKFLADHMNEAFELTCTQYTDAIKFDMTQEELNHYGSLLIEAQMQVPKLPPPSDTYGLNDVISKLYALETTLCGALEELEPMLDKWLTMEKAMISTVKGLTGLEHEWQGASVYHTLVPNDVYRRIRAMEEMVGEYKWRLTATRAAWEKLSRLLTLNMSSPSGELSRVGGAQPLPPYGGGQPFRSK